MPKIITSLQIFPHTLSRTVQSDWWVQTVKFASGLKMVAVWYSEILIPTHYPTLSFIVKNARIGNSLLIYTLRVQLNCSYVILWTIKLKG